MPLLKIARKVLIPTGVLIAVFLIVGFVYSLVSVPEKPASTNKKAASSSDLPLGEIKPTKPGANAPEGVSVYLAQESVKAGQNAGASAQTNAGSTCVISVTYNGMASQDSGLGQKTADDFGNVSWTWTVGADVPAGSWPVKVTCTYNGRSGVSIANLAVVR